ncbi:PREDICTED: LOW QUALITY PROTEIN: glucosidase 2 subunit beta-like [Priapulus caudatus]|uniref:Glucosidase 2 subunit beta n=1 Tax=Priapulus caudatus TaxID=37621 RepID=A0ABM1E2B2_PRICU|nr:PREDICTED: LOW QUALITY PROTEIN: glucosidase 2 subunit beta-like [Priapulus caudatus]
MKRVRHISRRRAYGALLLLAIVSAIFLCFQIFSVKKLGSFDHYGKKSELILRPTQQKRPSELDSKDVSFIDHASAVRGVLPEHWHLYKIPADGTFMCFDKRLSIPYSYLNDNYCDCDDGSDEPSTSACESARFYCDYQPADWPLVLRSNRVNDGICDCCDGSDEWDYTELPAALKLSVSYLDRIRTATTHKIQTPCKNYCDKIDQLEESLKHMQEEGAKRKKQYIEEGKAHARGDVIVHFKWLQLRDTIYRLTFTAYGRKERSNADWYEAHWQKMHHVTETKRKALLANKQNPCSNTRDALRLYGRAGEYHKLSKMCFKFDHSGFVYNVCPFKHVDQLTNTHGKLSLGDSPNLKLDRKTGKWVLSMFRGSTAGCMNKERQSKIVFECGVEDKVLSVSEDEKCIYEFHMSTPAAC